MHSTIVFAVLFGLAIADPQIIWLNQYSTDSTNNIVTVEPGGKLYLASNDDITTLLNIRILTGTTAFTPDQLPVDGLTLLSDQLIIQSALDPTTAGVVSGFLYATTAVQANDNTFEVTVVTQPRNFNLQGTKKTLVVLNTKFTTTHIPPADAPKKTAYVTDVRQDQNTDLNFHYGYPGVNWTSENQFFQNPQYFKSYDANGKLVNQTRVFFNSVEPIQVNLPYWYITSNGPINIKLDSIYINLKTHNTTNVNTTGAYVLTDLWVNQYVNFVTDPTRSGWSGSMITTDLQYPVNVTFKNENAAVGEAFSGGNGIAHGQALYDMAPKTLTISTNAERPGILYCQYFYYTGDLLPPSPSTSTVVTTTGSADSLSIIIAFFIIVCTFWQ